MKYFTVSSNVIDSVCDSYYSLKRKFPNQIIYKTDNLRSIYIDCLNYERAE